MSFSPRIRVGVIGVGKMGELHLQKLCRMPGVEPSGIFDSSEARRKDIEGCYGVPSFSTPAELLFESDAVTIATPTSTHYSVGRLALEAGVHLLIEKPITDSVDEAEELARLAESKGLVLQVGLIERFRYRALAGDILRGQARFIETQRLTPHLARDASADVITDLMIHDLDLVLALMGEDPVHVSAIGVRVLTDQVDMANVRLEFLSGAAVNLNVSRVSLDPVRKLRVFFDDLYASLDFIDNSVKVYSRTADRSIQLVRRDRVVLDPLAEQIADFVECIKVGRKPVVTAQDGIRALRFAKTIVQKIHERPSRRSAAYAPEQTLREH